MDKKIFDEVLERLEESYRAMESANDLSKRNGEKLSCLENLLDRLDEAIQRWSGRSV